MRWNDKSDIDEVEDSLNKIMVLNDRLGCEEAVDIVEPGFWFDGESTQRRKERTPE